MSDDSALTSHSWIEERWREITSEERILGEHNHCSLCLRDFVIENATQRIFAARIGAMRFYELDAEVTVRWVEESCPGEPRASDEEDRKRILDR